MTLSAGLLAKKVKASGKYDFRVQELTDKVCSIKFFERSTTGSSEIGTSTFTIEDAKKAQVKNLDKFGRNMLYARAMSNGVRWFALTQPKTSASTPRARLSIARRLRPLPKLRSRPRLFLALRKQKISPTGSSLRTIDAIRKLWPDYGMKEGGKLFDLDQVCLKRWKRKLDEAKEEDAQKLLTWLQGSRNGSRGRTKQTARSEQPQAGPLRNGERSPSRNDRTRNNLRAAPDHRRLLLHKTCTVYYCVCECGADRWVRSPKLKSGKVTACVYCTAKALVKHKEERSRKVIDLNILTDDQKRLMAYLIRSRVQIKPYNPKRVFIEAYEEARASPRTTKRKWRYTTHRNHA